MSNYTDLIYPEDINNTYPEKLCQYVSDRFFKTGGKLLDLGCNKGTHFRKFESLGFDCYGVDIRKDIESDKVSICNIEKDKLPFDKNTFDFVWSKSVIEHVSNADNLLNEVYRVLKPGGVCVLMTPDWESQMSHFWEDYTHVKAWTGKSLANALRMKGFDAVCEKFYQLPFIWKNPQLKIIPRILSVCPQSWKWKDKSMSNGKDRKLIRFSKEQMLLAWGTK